MKMLKHFDKVRSRMRRTPSREEGLARSPIKISQLAYLILLLLIYWPALDGLPVPWTSPGSSGRSVGLFSGRCFTCVHTLCGSQQCRPR